MMLLGWWARALIEEPLRQQRAVVYGTINFVSGRRFGSIPKRIKGRPEWDNSRS